MSEKFEYKNNSEGKKDELIESATDQDIEMARRAAEGKGKILEELYQGFFGSKENCEIFAHDIPQEMFDRNPATIVDAGSSQGILGNYIKEQFLSRGSSAELIMLDTNDIAMKQSPVMAEKVNADLRENPLRNESADIVILRSVLQYAKPDDQVLILKEIRRILKTDGVLVSQFCSYDSQKEAECFNNLFAIAKRSVNFCGKKELIKLHEEIFSEIVKVAEGPTLYETFDEFFKERINATQEQIIKSKEYIRQNIEEMNGIFTNKKDPYAWKIPYTILTCKK